MAVQTKARSAVAYKKLLIEAKELQGQAGAAAHRRAQILCQLFDDAEFRADIGASDDFAVESFLDELVEDLSLGFLELRAMLSEFPAQESWADGKLATLYAKAVDQIRARKPTKEETVLSRPRITKEAFEQVKAEKQDAVARLNYAEQRIEETKKGFEQLEKENRELRMENERLKGRIEELERIARREFAVTGK